MDGIVDDGRCVVYDRHHRGKGIAAHRTTVHHNTVDLQMRMPVPRNGSDTQAHAHRYTRTVELRTGTMLCPQVANGKTIWWGKNQGAVVSTPWEHAFYTLPKTDPDGDESTKPGGVGGSGLKDTVVHVPEGHQIVSRDDADFDAVADKVIADFTWDSSAVVVQDYYYGKFNVESDGKKCKAGGCFSLWCTGFTPDWSYAGYEPEGSACGVPGKMEDPKKTMRSGDQQDVNGGTDSEGYYKMKDNDGPIAYLGGNAYLMKKDSMTGVAKLLIRRQVRTSTTAPWSSCVA